MGAGLHKMCPVTAAGGGRKNKTDLFLERHGRMSSHTPGLGAEWVRWNFKMYNHCLQDKENLDFKDQTERENCTKTCL